MKEHEIPEEMSRWIDEALELVLRQRENPHVYNENTQEALDKISAYAAIFKFESAKAYLEDRTLATFYTKHCEALEYMINSLKYKIRRVTN